MSVAGEHVLGFASGPLLLVAVPAAASMLAAVLAARSARTSQTAEADAQRLRALEERLAEKKYEVYEPIMKTFQRLFDRKGADNTPRQQAEMVQNISDFYTWVCLFGSDESVRSFGRMQQAFFDEAPSQIALRLYAEFILESRRDIGEQATSLTPTDIFAGRINDLYSADTDMLDALTLDFDDLCRKYEWVPPWRSQG